ncbi:MAG: serpin family protein [Halobacteria archaeon]|nr:serpin family protein [Halobacteria archaeon]
MGTKRRKFLALLGASLAGSGLAGCLGDTTDDGNGTTGPQLLASNLKRETPDIDTEIIDKLVDGNTDFAFDLLDQLVTESPQSNLFVSPYSISVALAMTWAGARGKTEDQMADAMHYTLGQDRLHTAFNALDQKIEEANNNEGSNNEDDENGEEKVPFQLEIANSIWGQRGYPFRDEYLDTLARNYGAGLRTLDFSSNPNEARETINNWVEEKTNDRIKDLLPEGVITALTRLVLTNAIYFKANWQHTFPEEATEDAEFKALDGSKSTVPMMQQSNKFPYAEVDGHKLIELPYVGNRVGMVVMLPKEGEYEEFENSLNSERLEELLGKLKTKEGTIHLPKFEYDSKFALKNALSALGMPVAFDPNKANFEGMADLEKAGGNLYIRSVVHKSNITVDEKGTEAAAATGVVVNATSAPIDPFEMVVDRPFVFLIRDRKTGSLLFLGRIVDAGEAQ